MGTRRNWLIRVIAFCACVLATAAVAAPELGRAGGHKRRAIYHQPGWHESTAIVIPADVDDVQRRVRFSYRSHDGVLRRAILLLPAHTDHAKPLPLILSPHGRGAAPETTTLFWGDLPGRDDFAVVIPAGMGRKLPLFAWGYAGDVEDLARMPRLVAAAAPDVAFDPRRVYAFGGSMGGQEVLLLLARHPHLLAGVASFDAPTNMVKRYGALLRLDDGRELQRSAREEIGGSPRQVPAAYAARSPLTFATQIARSGVPLQIWWSVLDSVVRLQAQQSGALYKAILRANPDAPVVQVTGRWRHTVEMEWDHRLPSALERFGLAPRP